MSRIPKAAADDDRGGARPPRSRGGSEEGLGAEKPREKPPMKSREP